MSGLLVYHALAFVSPRARVLPATVASPVCVASTPADLERLEVAADFTGSGSATQSFASLGLPPTVVSNLEELLGAGALPNALQAASYSVLAGGRDAVIDAHTGSGKTLALLLPVVSQLDAAVRESLCLSSSQATLDAGRCPEGPNPNQAALAAYGLSEPGEAPPQFMIDMDRLAFQLAQMGADAGAIERLMLGLSEARREAIRSPALTRQMDRDRENLTDHLGVSNPFDEEG